MSFVLPIYLDYMASTPVDPTVLDVMRGSLETHVGNPASQHRYGWEANVAVDQAREQVAALVHADPYDIIWTGSATESNNLAIKGAAYFYQRKGKHLITLSTEHPSVLNTFAYLADHGFEVTYLDPTPSGMLALTQLEAALRPDTLLVSVMHVNNETGVIQDIDAIGQLVHQRGALFHVDAAQSAGKLPIDLKQLPVDLMSFSGHKLYGPKGVGALYIRKRPRVHLEPLFQGGGHERGLRSSTLATHQIVGMGKAFELAKMRLVEDQQYIQHLVGLFWDGLTASLPDIVLHGANAPRIPGCLNIAFLGIKAEPLITSLVDLAVSGGSACAFSHTEPSHVLLAMGYSPEHAQNAVRFSFGRVITMDAIDYAVRYMVEHVQRLRSMSPIWDSVKQGLTKKASVLEQKQT